MSIEKLSIGCIIFASLIFAMRVWYFIGYKDGLKEAQRILEKNTKER